MAAEGDFIALQINGGELTPILSMPHSGLTILQLKTKIAQSLGVDVERQTLYAEVQLEDERTMAHYGLETHCAVRLFADPLPEDATFNVRILVWSQNRYVESSCEVQETETVLDLKRKIVEQHYPHVPVQEMKMYVWLIPTEMKDDQQLCKYYLREGSKLAVRINKRSNSFG